MKGGGLSVGRLMTVGAVFGVLLLLFGVFGEHLSLDGNSDGDGSDARFESRLEARLEELLSELDGVSDVHAMIYIASNDDSSYNNTDPQIVGIAVTCRASEALEARVTLLISTLFGLSTSQVCVNGR